MKFVIFTITLVTLALAISCRFHSRSKGAFSKTCKNISLQGSVLTATCDSWKDKTKKAEIATKVDLKDCLGNIDGKLTWKKVEFSKTSKNCKLDGVKLACESQTTKGDYKPTYYDLDSTISNIDGHLQCDKRRRRF